MFITDSHSILTSATSVKIFTPIRNRFAEKRKLASALPSVRTQFSDFY